MNFLHSMLDGVIKRIPSKKREEMMVEMMPEMMGGIDLNEFMPKAVDEMIKDLSVDDVVSFLQKTVQDKGALLELTEKIRSANLMQSMMTKSSKSRLGFDETVAAIREAAPKHGWLLDTRDLQNTYLNNKILDMTRMTIIYFCNPAMAYEILEDDNQKPMSVMMPMGVSAYETASSNVEVATWNMDLMSNFFPGVTGDVLNKGAENLSKTLNGIVE